MEQEFAVNTSNLRKNTGVRIGADNEVKQGGKHAAHCPRRVSLYKHLGMVNELKLSDTNVHALTCLIARNRYFAVPTVLR